MKLRWTIAQLTLREPLRISRSVMSRRDAVGVIIECDGLAGHGEVVTSRYLGLDTTGIIALLTGFQPVLEAFDAPEDLLDNLHACSPALQGAPAVLAAVDAALHDLVGLRSGKPVHEVLGDPLWTEVATAYTIGITDAEHAARAAADLTGRGFTVLKVKTGSANPARDITRLAAIRQAAPRASLLLDANGAWDAEQAVRILDAVAHLDVAAVEQPIPPGDPDRLAWIGARTPVPVIADEDAASLADVRRIAGAVHGINVKLAKCGGIKPAQEIISAAQAANMDVMLGCLVSSSLGIAPAVHLTGAARWVDLDGHLLLRHDPWTGIGGADGVLRLNGRAGLGVVGAQEAA